MADTELYVTEINTNQGLKKIDYNALANLPKFDDNWKNANDIASAKDLSDYKEKIDNDIVKANFSISSTTSRVSNLASNFQLFQQEINNRGYITEDQLIEKKYVTEDGLSKQGYVTETQLSDKGYVTETELSNQGYVTETQLKKNLVASTSQPGVVKPGSGLTVSADGTLSVNKHPLEELSNINVLDAAPETVVNGQWYLVRVEE